MKQVLSEILYCNSWRIGLDAETHGGSTSTFCECKPPNICKMQTTLTDLQIEQTMRECMILGSKEGGFGTVWRVSEVVLGGFERFVR